MTSKSCYVFTHSNIFLQSFFYFRTKINNHFISAFTCYLYSIVFKIYIFNIKSNTLRNTNSCTKQKSNDCQITFLGFLIINTFLASEFIVAMFNIIQQHSHLISVQTNDAFFMRFWNVNKNRRISLNKFMFIVICIKTSQCRNFTL